MIINIILFIIFIIYGLFTSIIDIQSKSVYCFSNYLFLFFSLLLILFANGIDDFFRIFLIMFFYGLIIITLFAIFNVGNGDAEILLCLVPLLYHISNCNIFITMNYLILQLLFALFLALFVQGIKYIFVKNKEDFAFAPYIMIVTLLFFILIL